MKMRGRKPKLWPLFYLIFVICIFNTHQRPDGSLFPVANALSSLKLNAIGQPRLCSVVEGSLNGLTRICFGKANQKDINVKAISNRNVLQGKLESLQVSIQKTQSSLLALDSFKLNGNDLNFGYLPLAILVGIPTFFWFVPAKLMVYLLFLSFLWRNQREYLSPELGKKIENWIQRNGWSDLQKSVQTGMQRQKERLSKFLIGNGPCKLQYTISMTNESLKNSGWVQLLARSLVQSFLANSALPLAAAVSDVTNNLMLLEESTSSTTSNKANLKSASADSNNSILALWNEQEQLQRQNQSSSKMASPSFPMTELFAATSFELRDSPVFAKDGHVWLPCIANLPDASKSQLEFTLRTKPQVAGVWQQQQGLEFTAAECSLDVNAVVDTNSTPEWAKQFLPQMVWLPIGSAGMVLPTLGKKFQWKRITVQQDLCQLQGEIDLFRPTNSARAMKIGTTLGNMLQSFTTKRNKGDNGRPKLPGGK